MKLGNNTYIMFEDDLYVLPHIKDENGLWTIMCVSGMMNFVHIYQKAMEISDEYEKNLRIEIGTEKARD